MSDPRDLQRIVELEGQVAEKDALLAAQGTRITELWCQKGCGATEATSSKKVRRVSLLGHPPDRATDRLRGMSPRQLARLLEFRRQPRAFLTMKMNEPKPRPHFWLRGTHMAFAALRRPMLTEVAVPFLLSSIVLLGMANCKTAPSAKDGQAAVPSPSWSNAAYARQRSDEAWHFAYAVQSWAAQHNAHLIMVPAHSNIVVAKSFFAEEFSQVPISSFPDGRGSNPDQVSVLKHRWTGHGSSWDYDTDIKFVMYGPGYVKEGLRLDKTTLQNLAPTYAQLIGTDAPRGSAGRVMTEALAGKGNRPKVILTIVMDGGGLTLYRAWPNAWPVIKGLASRGVEYLDAKITQLETATGPSHAVIGTGGYPFTTRIVGNDVYDPAKKQMVSFFPEFSPDDLRAPTLADEYGLKTGHRAVVIGASFSAMPAGLRMKLATSITALSSGGARAATFTAMGPEKDSATRANGSLVGSRRSTIATSALASVTASAG